MACALQWVFTNPGQIWVGSRALALAQHTHSSLSYKLHTLHETLDLCHCQKKKKKKKKKRGYRVCSSGYTATDTS
jgi:hypothetical protein